MAAAIAAAAMAMIGAPAPAQAASAVAEHPGPVAAFTTAPSSPEAGQAVSFDGSSSTGSIASYAWSFGDGQRGSGASATHRYAAAGTYTVALTVTDGAGRRSTVAHTVTVVSGPTAAFTASPAPTGVGVPVSFDGTGSTIGAPGTAITAYAWSFGDGATATGPTPSHAYGGSGTYTVQLTVTDSAGQSATVSHAVTVYGPPQALFAFAPALPLAGAPVSFDATGSFDLDPGSSIVSYRWSFGDGSATAAGATASHIYASAGTYTLSLTVTDGLGMNETTTGQVTVASGRPDATIAVRAPQPAPGRAVDFTGSASAGALATIVSYRWSFGDGSTAVGRVATHVYRKPGRYVVTLTVRDSTGASTVTTRTVAVPRLSARAHRRRALRARRTRRTRRAKPKLSRGARAA